MVFTIDSSRPNRSRILISDPFDVVIDLRFVDDEGASTALAVSASFKPDDAAALTTFIKNLDANKLATFVEGAAESMLTLAATINGS